MRWDEERYVRLYTRDTVTWKLLPWQSRCLLPLVMRKADRDGSLDLSGAGTEGLAALVELPLEVTEPGLAGLLARGVVAMDGDVLRMPNFRAAQESRQTDAARKREQRERDKLGQQPFLSQAAAGTLAKMARDDARHTESPPVPPDVTPCHTESPAVTKGHSSLAELSLAEPSLASPPKPPMPRTAREGPVISVLEELKADWLEARGEELATEFADERALEKPLAEHGPALVRQHWRNGLSYAKAWQATSVRQLASAGHWNAWARPESAAPPGRKGPTRAQDVKWAKEGEVDAMF